MKKWKVQLLINKILIFCENGGVGDWNFFLDIQIINTNFIKFNNIR